MSKFGPLAIDLSHGHGHGEGVADAFDSPYSWRVIILTLVITSLSFGAVTSVLLKPIAAEWGLGIRSVSLMHMSSMMGAGFGSLLLGCMVDRFGFFKIAIAGALATTAGLTLAAEGKQLLTLHLAFGLLVGGLGQAAFFSPIAAESSRWFCRHRPFAIAVAASGQSLGGLIMPFVLRAWSDAYGWRTALLIYSVVAGFTMLLCALVLRRAAPGTPVHAGGREAAAPLGVVDAVRDPDLDAAGCRLAVAAVDPGAGLALGPSRALLAMTAVQYVGTLVLFSAQGLGAILTGAVLVGLGFDGYLPSYLPRSLAMDW